MQIRYRSFVSDDLPRLLKLALQFETSPFSFDPEFLRLSDEYHPFFAHAMLTKKGTTTLVAESENGVEGFVSMGINSVAETALHTKVGTILLLVVNKKLRNRGIAKHLVSSALNILKHNGVKVVTVGTDVYNYPALHVYEGLGFRMQMAWHIYRYYAHWQSVLPQMADEVEIAEPQDLDFFRQEFDRPVSLLWDNKLKSHGLRALLFENLYRSLIKGSTYALMWKDGRRPRALLQYQRDEIALSTLRLDAGIYRILDIWGDAKFKVSMVQDLMARLRDFKLLEYWVRAENQAGIRTAEESGMRLSYTGVSLHLHF